MITLEKSPVRGEILIPSSKSQTIRALLLATFSHERSVIENPLESSDTQACINACTLLGAKIEFSDDRRRCYVDATGVDARGKSFTIDTMNSGTTIYLIYGLLAAEGAREIVLTGDEQLNRRPILPLVEAYRDLGVEAEIEGECPPVRIRGELRGGRTSIECRTSQYLSSLLLSLPLAKGDSVVDCPILYEKPYVKMTLGWLDRQNIEYTISEDLQHVEIPGRQRYHGFETMVTGDYSSASFFFVMAAITAGTITVSGLDRNDVQGDRHILDILEKMGCRISWNGYSVTVEGPEKLLGGTFDLNSMPDALPILAVAAAAASEPVSLVNVAQARIKETDRIRCMRENLESLGCNIAEREDGLEIRPSTLHGGPVRGFGDHRIIMAMAVCSLIASSPITIDDERACSVTFPTFFRLFESLKEER